MTRRTLLSDAGRTALSGAVLAPVLNSAIVSCANAADAPVLNIEAGLDRVVILPGKTYLRGWAGYGPVPHPGRPVRRGTPPPPPAPAGPAVTVAWSKESGPGSVAFADAKAPITTASFTTPGAYVLKLTAGNGQAQSVSTLHVLVETPPPAQQLGAVYTRNFKISSPLWNARAKALIVNWIPHCIDQINRTDIKVGPGGIDNFVEAGKALRGEPHGLHKGYVFSNAWVHQTVEAMSIALMVDPQGDAEIIAAHKKMRATLDDWIPKILAGQEPDGYLQTAFTLSREGRDGRVIDTAGFKHWDPAHRGDHEGYVAGYFLESAINHYLMTDRKDARLYNAAKKLADCWYNNLGPAPKKPWFDGHQQIEQGLVRFGRFVNDMEGGKGDHYIELAKFLLDSRYTTATGPREQQEYDQSHLPVTQQYEAVGHAVRAAYTYSGMADVAVGDA
ncbi:MAG: glycoside hydrolase family 127 protein [Paludibaculum sp.]